MRETRIQACQHRYRYYDRPEPKIETLKWLLTIENKNGSQVKFAYRSHILLRLSRLFRSPCNEELRLISGSPIFTSGGKKYGSCTYRWQPVHLIR